MKAITRIRHALHAFWAIMTAPEGSHVSLQIAIPAEGQERAELLEKAREEIEKIKAETG